MDKLDVVVGAFITTLVVAAGLIVLSFLNPGPIHTYEGELVDIETSAGGFGHPDKTTFYFEDGTVFVFDLIDEILVLHENYLVRYRDSPLRFVSIEMIGVE